jgi:hypothetical protein
VFLFLVRLFLFRFCFFIGSIEQSPFLAATEAKKTIGLNIDAQTKLMNYLFKLTMPLGFLDNTLLHSFSLPLIVN